MMPPIYQFVWSVSNYIRHLSLNNFSILLWLVVSCSECSEETVLFLSHKSHCLTIILLSLCVIYPKCKINKDVKCQGRGRQATGLILHLTFRCFPSWLGGILFAGWWCWWWYVTLVVALW